MLNYSYRSYNSHVSQPQRWEDLHKMPPEIVVHSLPPCFAALSLQCVCEELVLQMAIHLEVFIVLTGVQFPRTPRSEVATSRAKHSAAHVLFYY